MKFLCRLIGLIMIILVVTFTALFFLESHGWLGEGELTDFVRMMHIHYEEVKDTVVSFVQSSGIANEAADLMDKGAQKLRGEGTTSPEPLVTATPIPTQIVFSVVTPKPIG